jgi:hypothetical protein
MAEGYATFISADGRDPTSVPGRRDGGHRTGRRSPDGTEVTGRDGGHRTGRRSPDGTEVTREDGGIVGHVRPCPACGRKIQDAAPRCHFCHATVPHVQRTPREEPARVARQTEPIKRRGSTALMVGIVVAVVLGALVAFWR